MSKVITIDPVSRVEGHGKVTIHLDDKGQVSESHFHIQEFRGFEKFCQERMVWEMPNITTRICGICPVSHHLASVKACDDLFQVEIPPAAKKLRELMHMGQLIHSHALHFFYLAAPDLLFDLTEKPELRNVVGLIGKDPDLARKAIRLRQIGQDIVERVGGRAIHPVTAIPGGMSKALTHDDRYQSGKDLQEALALAVEALQLVKQINDKYRDMIEDFASFPSSYMGLTKDGALELYDGNLRIVNSSGEILEDFDPRDYLNYIGEQSVANSYLKYPFYKKLGWPDGVYRVAPLARLNIAERITTEKANAELAEFKALGAGRPVEQSLYYHYARIIELLHAVERAGQLLEDDDIVSRDVRVVVKRQAGEGVGVIEAPRGTLIHHYVADDMGKLEKVNIVVATAHNYAAMDKAVNNVAKKLVKDADISEPLLNQVEMAIRCYDPCLSCSTHKLGQMPLDIQIVAADGTLIRRSQRRA